MAFDFTGQWIKGEGNTVSDMLSHNPVVVDPQLTDTEAE